MSKPWLMIAALGSLALQVSTTSFAPSTKTATRLLDSSTTGSPYTVGLRSTADGDNLCAGALIAPNKGLVSKDYYFSIGSTSLSGTADGERIKINKLYTHPDYDMKTRQNEFFLLQLDTESKFTPVAMAPASGAGITYGSSATAFGWGNDDATGPTLQKAPMVFMNPLRCSRKVSMTSTHLCAVTADNATETCKLEPGSPLYLDKKDVTTVVGVLSFNNNCRKYLEPAEFSEVSFARKWIKTIAGV